MTEENKKNLSRRDALKFLGAAAGATVLANLPANWSTPELAAGVLPAHAQTSNCGDYMQAVSITTTLVNGEYADFDFMLCTPNGNLVWGGNSAEGATSSADNINFDPNADNETLDIASAIAGTYAIYLVNFTGSALEMAIQITTATGVHSVSFTLPASGEILYGRAVADVTFPCGNLTWRADEILPPCAGGQLPEHWASKKKKN